MTILAYEDIAALTISVMVWRGHLGEMDGQRCISAAAEPDIEFKPQKPGTLTGKYHGQFGDAPPRHLKATSDFLRQRSGLGKYSGPSRVCFFSFWGGGFFFLFFFSFLGFFGGGGGGATSPETRGPEQSITAKSERYFEASRSKLGDFSGVSGQRRHLLTAYANMFNSALLYPGSRQLSDRPHSGWDLP